MKRIFITLIAILSIGFKTGAQAPQVPVDSTNIQILNELREIKVIQDSTFKQRQEAIANRQRNASKDGDTTKVKSLNWPIWAEIGAFCVCFSVCF